MPVPVAAVLAFAPLCQAQSPGKIDLEAAEMLAELVGAPVFASDGPQIGEAADVSFDEERRPQRLRMTTGAMLGLGVRTIEIPKGVFTALRGAVVLDLPLEAVQSLPEPPKHGDEK